MFIEEQNPKVYTPFGFCLIVCSIKNTILCFKSVKINEKLLYVIRRLKVNTEG